MFLRNKPMFFQQSYHFEFRKYPCILLQQRSRGIWTEAELLDKAKCLLCFGMNNDYALYMIPSMVHVTFLILLVGFFIIAKRVWKEWKKWRTIKHGMGSQRRPKLSFNLCKCRIYEYINLWFPSCSFVFR